jgi:quinol monooxygenase YgiN
MYGTVARMRLKAGMEQELARQLADFEAMDTPGFVRTTLYRMDANGNELLMAVVFADKDAYVANAQSPEQDARYQAMRALMESDPERNDGEVIHETSA